MLTGQHKIRWIALKQWRKILITIKAVNVKRYRFFSVAQVRAKDCLTRMSKQAKKQKQEGDQKTQQGYVDLYIR